jgi:hypothetical protein
MYGVSKLGEIALTYAWSRDLLADGIIVNAVRFSNVGGVLYCTSESLLCLCRCTLAGAPQPCHRTAATGRLPKAPRRLSGLH